MTILLTLLTLWIEPKPAVPQPSAPTAGTLILPGEADYEVTFSGGLTTPAFSSHNQTISPSWMVACPPLTVDKSLNVFAPDVRPPHEFPTLLPCPPVALVPCPSPVFPAGIQQASFLEPASQHACKPQPTISSNAPATVSVGKAHSGFHCVAAPAIRPVAATVPPCVGGACPAGFAAVPPGAGGACPVGYAAVPQYAPAPPAPLPGAKHVQHIVRATYELNPQAISQISPFLENSENVFGYQVDGNRLTINATAPAQVAVAQFLAVLVPEKKNSGSIKSVKYTKAGCEKCKDDCACKNDCKCGKPQVKTIAIDGPNDKVFSFYIGTCDRNCKDSASKTKSGAKALAVEYQKPVEVKVKANGSEVMMTTSNGTQIRCKSISFTTMKVDNLKLENGGNVTNSNSAYVPISSGRTVSPKPTY